MRRLNIKRSTGSSQAEKLVEQTQTIIDLTKKVDEYKDKWAKADEQISSLERRVEELTLLETAIANKQKEWWHAVKSIKKSINSLDQQVAELERDIENGRYDTRYLDTSIDDIPF
jgi:chromosome segregation ATPase